MAVEHKRKKDKKSSLPKHLLIQYFQAIKQVMLIKNGIPVIDYFIFYLTSDL